MNYDGLLVAAVAAELKRALIGGHIQQVRQHNDTDFTLEIRSSGRSYLLFMSVNARFSRVYLTASNSPAPKQALNFCMLLRKHVKGSFVTDVEQAGFDRVIKLKTEAPDGNRNSLVLELMGKHSNLILVTDTGRIVGAAKYVTAAMSRYRQVLPGRDYLPPPGGEKENPVETTFERFEDLWKRGLPECPASDEVKRWLVAAFSGIGPFLAEEIVLGAGDGVDLQRTWAAVQMLRQIVSEHDYAPVIISDDRGHDLYAYPIPVRQFAIANQHERSSTNEILDALFRELIGHDAYNSELAGLETVIRRGIASRQQTCRHLAETIAEGGKAERYKEFGDLLLAVAGTVPKGEASALVTDYYDPEMRQIEIPLDDKLTAQENAERYFKRYRKAREGALAAVDRLKEITLETAILQSAADGLPAAKSVENVRALREMLTSRGLLRPEPKVTVPGKREESEFGGAKIRRMTSTDGLEILWGENSTSNDYLTSKVARPNDYWLHARSVTGAHVVIRTAKHPELVPKRTIMEAAEVAARNSDAKHSSLVAVDYTLKKFVRKPRAAAPGLVTYQKEKTIDISPNLR